MIQFQTHRSRSQHWLKVAAAPEWTWWTSVSNWSPRCPRKKSPGPSSSLFPREMWAEYLIFPSYPIQYSFPSITKLFVFVMECEFRPSVTLSNCRLRTTSTLSSRPWISLPSRTRSTSTRTRNQGRLSLTCVSSSKTVTVTISTPRQSTRPDRKCRGTLRSVARSWSWMIFVFRLIAVPRRVQKRQQLPLRQARVNLSRVPDLEKDPPGREDPKSLL